MAAATLAGPAAASLAGGCTQPGRGRLEMAVGWGGAELDQFRRVARGYEPTPQLTPVGDDIDPFLRTRHRANAMPDVAMVPRPGLVRAYARRGWLEPLDHLADRFPARWNQLVTEGGHVYGVWLRSAHKSLFWYLPSVFGGPTPGTWDELVDLVGDLAAAHTGNGDGDGDRPRHPAPLAVGAADGWVLTDWFENVLAARADPGLYTELGEGRPRWDDPAVREAFADLAELWRIPGAFPGGGGRALLTQFDHSVMQVARREATLVFEADFVATQADGFLDDTPGAERLVPFRFPSPTERRPLVVGGDVAVVPRGSDAGLELVEWLTDPGVDAFKPWREEGGYLSPHLGVPLEKYPELERRLVAEIREPAEGFQFDLSDLLPGEMNGAEGVGSWRVLQDFFAQVTETDPDVTAAIEEAVEDLNEQARRVTEQDSAEVPS
jgi:ABC-type glycerol-3-phosphate transport system substrate-binding protein